MAIALFPENRFAIENYTNKKWLKLLLITVIN